MKKIAIRFFLLGFTRSGRFSSLSSRVVLGHHVYFGSDLVATKVVPMCSVFEP
jgi:hypothetical protein